ncbi:MAG: hypothetical protein MK101_06795 [Phycisphaerales bacterium]|nr:hypothetical protein [Phycisphaerales bacterium]
MPATARHILELTLLIAACRLGGVELHGDSSYRKGTPAETHQNVNPRI